MGLEDEIRNARVEQETARASEQAWTAVHGSVRDNAVVAPQGDWADLVRDALRVVPWRSAEMARSGSYGAVWDGNAGLAFRRLYRAPDGSMRLSSQLLGEGRDTWSSKWLSSGVKGAPLPGELVRVVTLVDGPYGVVGQIFQLTESGLVWVAPAGSSYQMPADVYAWSRQALVDWLASKQGR